jgi:hypothetical protein
MHGFLSFLWYFKAAGSCRLQEIMGFFRGLYAGSVLKSRKDGARIAEKVGAAARKRKTGEVRKDQARITQRWQL